MIMTRAGGGSGESEKRRAKVAEGAVGWGDELCGGGAGFRTRLFCAED